MTSALRLVLVAAVAAACAPRTSPSPYPNEPECDTIVAARRANPEAPVDREPAATSIMVPPASRPRALSGRTYTIRFVVTERGTVDAASVEPPAEFPENFAAEIRRSLAEWTFVPARAGQCWVPVGYAYRLTL